ncbi:MAG: 2-amino-4-hydroxy-6-hydroxymethyldihydropteridine diphosphokinase [Chloroflexi bacterium]|nr:2-amino-4-hydroxy-6-hydroxymethyldihydropteridine diphosphokinase [Chloroflexota bacterium]
MNSVMAYLGLGSNLEDRQENLNKALEYLEQRFRLGLRSSIYDTAPVGVPDQPRFLNMVCQVFTMLSPAGLLAAAKGIELKLGRLPCKHGAPRPIDIDILFYDDKVVETPDLVIPHPRIAERAFVLVPLAEIAPDFVHPVKGKTIKELLQAVDKTQSVVRWGKG